MKDLIRTKQTYKLYKLPEIIISSFTWGRFTGHTGSIFRRRLSGLKGKIFWHYAFFYGFSEKNELILIENNQNGVEGITWDDFIIGFDDWEPVHFEETPDRFQEIMDRAKERANKRYIGGDNNCEHFVNYSVFGKLESIQAKNTKLLVDFIFTLGEVRVMMLPGDIGTELLDSLNDLRNQIGLKRKEEFNKIIEERKNLNK